MIREKSSDETIVIVDDRHSIRISLAREFEMGIRCMCFTGGKGALEFINQSKMVAAIVMDVLNPSMSGFTLRTLLKTSKAKDVPVVVYSGWPFSPEEMESLKPAIFCDKDPKGLKTIIGDICIGRDGLLSA